MPVTQLDLAPAPPMGANLYDGGATFRIWAPNALEVYLATGIDATLGRDQWTPNSGDAMVKHADGTWIGFVEGIRDGDRYMFYVVGTGSRGWKRDPYARELGDELPYPESACIVRDPSSYPWHDANFHPPRFHELLIYQLHVGVFYGVDRDGRDLREKVAKFLDVAARIPYLRKLGVNAVQLLPIQEYPYQNSLGYNNVDYFSPEAAYQLEAASDIVPYLAAVNALLAEAGHPPLLLEHLLPGPNQLKALVDLLHVNGITVIFDLVYNHAGGELDDASIDFLDRQPPTDPRNSLFFTGAGWAGGKVFDYSNDGVRSFLIDNARFFLDEYHIDGIRYDEVSVIDNHGGRLFAQELASKVRDTKPSAIQISEYWNRRRWLAVTPPPDGLGFDAALSDGLRDAIRGALAQASRGRDAYVSMDALRDALRRPNRFPASWRAVQCIENHDIVYADRKPEEWKPRVAWLADPSNPRSWYARSRARVAHVLLLTAPGIPMLFMGQEILEDKNWSDNPLRFANTLIWWDGLEHNRAMRDHLAFVRALCRLRREQPALSGEHVNPYHSHNHNRVLAFHRWLEGVGRDIVVVVSLNEATLQRYSLGFPQSGEWRELFNSDYFDHLPNPNVAGNGGRIRADPAPRHGLPASASITIPANGAIVFGR